MFGVSPLEVPLEAWEKYSGVGHGWTQEAGTYVGVPRAWQPATHRLFPPAVQSRVLLLLLVQARSVRGPLAVPAQIWRRQIIPYMPWRWR